MGSSRPSSRWAPAPGGLCLPLASAVRAVVVLERSQTMASALQADAATAGLTNLTIVPSRRQDCAGLSADGVLAAHLVYTLSDIEEFVHRLQHLVRDHPVCRTSTVAPRGWRCSQRRLRRFRW